jgi:hypothetical protein
MIQKIFISIFVFFILFFGIRFLKKIKSFGSQNDNSKTNSENIVDLEKDPKTNEYKPKE